MNLTERNALVEKHWRLAKREAGHFRQRVPIEYGDLLGEAALGMLDAAERYDPEKGAFGTLAVWRMRGAMTDYTRGQDAIGRTRRNDLDAVERTQEELGHELDREPTPADVYERLGVNDRVRREIERARVQEDVAHLDAPTVVARARWDGDKTLHGYIPGTLPSPEETTVQNERHSVLLDAIAKLPHRQRVVVVMSDLDRIKLHRIAACMGVTESRVSMIRKDAHKMLRELLTGSALDPAA